MWSVGIHQRKVHSAVQNDFHSFSNIRKRSQLFDISFFLNFKSDGGLSSWYDRRLITNKYFDCTVHAWLVNLSPFSTRLVIITQKLESKKIESYFLFCAVHDKTKIKNSIQCHKNSYIFSFWRTWVWGNLWEIVLVCSP